MNRLQRRFQLLVWALLGVAAFALAAALAGTAGGVPANRAWPAALDGSAD